MKRRASRLSWEFLELKLGIKNIYKIEMVDEGLVVYSYDGDTEVSEGESTLIQDNPKISDNNKKNKDSNKIPNCMGRLLPGCPPDTRIKYDDYGRTVYYVTPTTTYYKESHYNQ